MFYQEAAVFQSGLGSRVSSLLGVAVSNTKSAFSKAVISPEPSYETNYPPEEGEIKNAETGLRDAGQSRILMITDDFSLMVIWVMLEIDRSTINAS